MAGAHSGGTCSPYGTQETKEGAGVLLFPSKGMPPVT
jgi:hypothetical protein